MHPIPQKTTSPQMLYYRSNNPCFIHLGMYIFLSFGVGMLLIFIFRCIILFIFCPLTSRSCCLISCRLGNLCKGSCLLVFLMLSAKWRVNSSCCIPSISDYIYVCNDPSRLTSLLLTLWWKDQTNNPIF